MVIALVQDWDTAHDDGVGWLDHLGLAGLVAFALLLVVALVRGFLRRHRYRATLVLDEAARAELESAITDAETRTTGEIGVVVLERSDRHPGAEWLAGIVTALIGSALLAGSLPWREPALLLACQVGLGLVGLVAARFVPDFKRVFISDPRATEMAQEQAVQEFHAHGLHETAEKTGVLLFVSLLEHRVIVLGDSGIDARVDASLWEATDRAVIEGIRSGSLQAGLATGVARCADVLAEHFPGTHDGTDEVPNHVVVRAE